MKLGSKRTLKMGKYLWINHVVRCCELISFGFVAPDWRFWLEEMTIHHECQLDHGTYVKGCKSLCIVTPKR